MTVGELEEKMTAREYKYWQLYFWADGEEQRRARRG
jgi:hypothetical protein